MSLTVTEREHWKQRIAARIDKRIAAIEQANKPVIDGLKKTAREKALTALGIDELESQRVKAEADKARLERRVKQLSRQVMARIKGVEEEDVTMPNYYSGFESEIKAGISRRAEYELNLLLSTTEVGKQIAALKGEKDNLLDTIWLATSPAQVKELWQKLSLMLGDEETPLQKEALSLKAVE